MFSLFIGVNDQEPVEKNIYISQDLVINYRVSNYGFITAENVSHFVLIMKTLLTNTSIVRALNISCYLFSPAEHKKEVENNRILSYKRYFEFLGLRMLRSRAQNTYPFHIVHIFPTASRVCLKLVNFHAHHLLHYLVSAAFVIQEIQNMLYR